MSGFRNQAYCDSRGARGTALLQHPAANRSKREDPTSTVPKFSITCLPVEAAISLSNGLKHDVQYNVPTSNKPNPQA